MTNKLGELLQSGTASRRVQDYENTFDDYIAFAGGQGLDEIAEIPQKVRNADYLLEATDVRLIIELKQVSKYAKAQSVDAYFSDLLRQGRVSMPSFTSPGQLAIEPSSLSMRDWNDFYRKSRPQIPECLDKAASQIKATPTFLPPTDRRHVGVAILVNTGDYNLPVDLMFRITEQHAKRKWKAGRYSALDCILCFSMDMMKPGQHPLHSRAIVRTKEDRLLCDSAMYLLDKWVRYAADAVGAEVTFAPGEAESEPFQLGGGVAGKIGWSP